MTLSTNRALKRPLTQSHPQHPALSWPEQQTAVSCHSTLLLGRRLASRDQATPVSSPVSRQACLAKCSPSDSMTTSARLTGTATRAFVHRHTPFQLADLFTRDRPASATTASQPKSISVADDGTVFIAEINGVEAIRDNQKVFELKTSYAPSAVAAGRSINIVAVGEVGIVVFVDQSCILIHIGCRTRKSICMNGMVRR